MRANLTSQVAAGTEIKVTTADGTEIYSFQTPKEISNVVFSSSDIVAGETYLIMAATDGQEDQQVGSVVAGQCGSTGFGGGGMGGQGGP